MRKLTLLSLVLVIGGCSYLNSESQDTKLTPNELFCRNLKRDIIFDTSSPFSGGKASPTEKAEMYRIYDKHDCKKLEKK